MHDYLAIGIYYAIPAAVLFSWKWWKTDLICGTPDAYWSERFDIRAIALAVLSAALWPVAAFYVAKSWYLRWPYGEALQKQIYERDDKIKALEAELDRLK